MKKEKKMQAILARLKDRKMEKTTKKPDPRKIH